MKVCFLEPGEGAWCVSIPVCFVPTGEEEDEDDVSVSEMEATGTQSIRSPRGGESEDSEGVIVSHATGSRPGSRLSQQGVCSLLDKASLAWVTVKHDIFAWKKFS